MNDKNNIEHLKWYINENLNENITNEKENNLNNKFEEENNARKIVNQCNNFEDLEKALFNFNECKIKDSATNTIFGEGNKKAPILLIGEAPGAEEDKEGRPFCGRSGKLLDSMMHAINLYRNKNLYITNCVFWRPPANRRPTQEEIDLCKPFLEKKISFIKPKLIILLGSTAILSFLGKEYKISDVKRKIFQYSNQYLNQPIKLTAIFHPAYLIRQAMKKETTWHDLLYIKDILQKDNIYS